MGSGATGEGSMSELIMYIVVNSNVKMSPGKLAAQVAHVAVKASHVFQKGVPDAWGYWYSGSHTKIVLKAPETVLDDLLSKYAGITASVRDEGRTEIQKNTLTAIAFFQMSKDDDGFPPELRKLSLY